MKKNNFFLGMFAGILAFFLVNNFFAVNINVAGFKVNQIFSILDKYYMNGYNKDDAQDYMYYGLLSSLGDPYTSYMDKKTFTSFMEQTEGEYIGIGTVISVDENDGRLVIVSPYENSPAAKAGILPGDKILSVDNLAASKENYEQIVKNLKGAAGTTAKIKIIRPAKNNKVLEFNVVREKIDIPTVSHKVFDNIGYLRITNFDKNTYEQFVNAYNLISKNNLKGLIIDLRNNPGGLLDSVVKIADELVPKDCIVYTEDKNGNKKFIYSDDKYIKLPLVVLVNGNSASASEVLSGAIKDLKRGILVGSKTFGKGLVQNLFPLRDGSAVKVTVAKYYTPAGICINGKGIEPDYKIELPEDTMISGLEPKDDLQLQKALELLDVN